MMHTGIMIYNSLHCYIRLESFITDYLQKLKSYTTKHPALLANAIKM